LLDGTLSLDELEDLLGIEYPPGVNTHSYETLGGLVMHQLGRIPIATDSFEWAGWRFEVVDMDGRRVDKVLATPLH
jgi:putative hemolysin